MRHRAAEHESGAAAVEFALVLPVLLSLLFGIIAFGIIFAQQLALGNGARQGARFGVVDASRTCQDIQAEAQDASSTIAMDGSAVDVTMHVGVDESNKIAVCPPSDPSATFPCKDSAPGAKLFVYASYQSEIPVPFVTAEIDLESVGVFRCEFS